MLDIERYHISEIDPEIFKDKFRKRGCPVIISGLFDSIPSWSVEYLEKYLNGQDIVVRQFDENRGRAKEDWNSYSDMYELEFSEYKAMLESGEASQKDIYLSQLVLGSESKLYKTIADRIDMLKSKSGLNKKTWKNINCHLWLGPKGHIEPLHSDEGDSTLVQLYGRKHVTLFPSRHLKNLYPFPFFSKMEPWVCRVNIAKPDFKKYPRLKDALDEKMCGILDEGELLYIPAQWSHEVEIIDKEYASSFSIMWDIPFRRNFISVRSIIWYLLRITPERLKSAVYSVYYRMVKILA